MVYERRHGFSDVHQTARVLDVSHSTIKMPFYIAYAAQLSTGFRLTV